MPHLTQSTLMYITGHQQQVLFHLLPKVCPQSLNRSFSHKRQPNNAQHRRVTVQAAGLQDTMMQGLKKALGQVSILHCHIVQGHLLLPPHLGRTQHDLAFTAGLR